MDKPDEDLMREYSEGNQEALSMIFSRYKMPIFNYALRFLGNRADAEDIVGEVFLAVFGKRYRFDPRAKFSTWLYTVAHNSCISKIRQRKKLLSLWSKNETDEWQEWEITDSSGEEVVEELDRQELAKYIRMAIVQLPDEQKEALILREYHQLSYAQISTVLGCSLDKVKVLIFRAREGLRTGVPAFLKEERHD